MVIILQVYMCCRLIKAGGCGSYIMGCLEMEIAKEHDIAILESSHPVTCLYGHKGYKTAAYGIYGLENDVKLVYEIMEKKAEREWKCDGD